MFDGILTLNILDGPFVGIVYTTCVFSVLYLVVLTLRWRSRRRLMASLFGVVAGTALGFIAVGIASTLITGLDLTGTTVPWVVTTFAAIGLAIANLWGSKWPRKVIAAGSMVLFLVAGVIGVNADYGLDQTVGDLAGISTAKRIALPVQPKPSAAQPKDSAKGAVISAKKMLAEDALWKTWKAPAGMPTVGTVGTVVIPNTKSGFVSRPAGLYLPPAALVPNAPELPLVIMLMGQPGNPDPAYSALILNQFAARHNGLAPIVLVVDQLGSRLIDPLCLDTEKYGKAETFITQDAVDWARANLHVMQDAAHWTIAGYSNGGQCAVSLGAKYPHLWRNVLDISGEAYPGADNPTATLAAAFKGDAAAYQAQKPVNILAAHQYTDMTAIFTIGSDDSHYLPQAKEVSAAAKASGWNVTYFEVPMGGHRAVAIKGGMTAGFDVLYPRLGLSDPALPAP
ncbi:MAG: esterase [Microbacteriaceae bacterium]|nr:esterase [Microbacteriaceae bacterium]